MDDHARPRPSLQPVAIGLVAATVGTVTWVVTMASAPRRSGTGDMGDLDMLVAVLLAAAVVLGRGRVL